MTPKVATAVLISGSGSNLQALLDAAVAPDFPASIALVLSNKADAYGLQRAERAGIPTQVISHRDFPTREAFDAAMQEILVNSGVELICLAGFMRLLTPGFVEKWAGRMLNIHPSLLPAFKGLHTHERAIEAGVKFTGCTVHFVSAEMDAGPIIMQATVPVFPDDTPDRLRERVLEAEHRIYPQSLRLAASGRLRIEGGRVIAQDAGTPQGWLANPVYPAIS